MKKTIIFSILGIICIGIGVFYFVNKPSSKIVIRTDKDTYSQDEGFITYSLENNYDETIQFSNPGVDRTSLWVCRVEHGECNDYEPTRSKNSDYDPGFKMVPAGIKLEGEQGPALSKFTPGTYRLYGIFMFGDFGTHDDRSVRAESNVFVVKE